MNENRVDPIVSVGPDFCPNCLKSHVVDLYTIYDKPIGFTALLNYKKNIGESVNIPIKYARCRNCGVRYRIIWEKDKIFKSMDKSIINNFILQFSDFDMGDIEDAYFNASLEGIFRD